MKNLGLLLLSTLFIQSCGPAKPAGKTHVTKNGFVLGAYYDIEKPGTLDLQSLSTLPKVVNLKTVMTDVKDQGNRGTCTFFSSMALVEAAVKKDLNKDVNFSEEHLNYITKFTGNYNDEEGSEVEDNLITLKAFGVLYESDAPYEPSWFAAGMPCANMKTTAMLRANVLRIISQRKSRLPALRLNMCEFRIIQMKS